MNHSIMIDKKLVISEYLSAYQKVFTSIKEQCEKYKDNFSKKQIQYNEDKYNKFCYKILEQLNNFQIVILKVWIGCFTLNLKVLNLDKVNPLLTFQSTSEGHFGQVYTWKFLENDIAVKSHSITNIKNQLSKKLEKVIQQYSIFKICDALQCGPSVYSYFGFDLLIFRDSAQFAMEKCSARSLHHRYQEELRINLGILHKFKIMHMDINWNNIMFSPTYRKNIYIDFGFSEIIAEECGYKTYTYFKGTPRFISNEMLQLFHGDNSHGFVDLYYNDLTCLQTTLNSSDSKTKMNCQQLDGLQDYKPDFQEFALKKRIQNVNDYLQYLLILLKHQCYFNRDNINNILQLKQGYLMEYHGKRVLELFSVELPVLYFEENLFNQFKQLSNHHYYQQYLQKLKNSEQRIICIKQSSSFYNENAHFQQRLYQNLLEPNEEDENIHSFDYIESVIKHLKSVPLFTLEEEKSKYLSLFFNFIRFDKNNLNLSVKKEISKGLLNFVSIFTQQFPNDELSSIKSAFKYLLNYCLTGPQTKWKQENIFDLFFNFILLDLDFISGLQTIQQKINQNQYSCNELIRILYQYNLLYTIFELKYKFQNWTNTQKLIALLKKDIQKIEDNIIERCDKSEAENQKNIANIMKKLTYLKAKPTSLYELSQQALKFFQDEQTKFILIKMCLLAQFKNAFNTNDFSLYTHIQQKIKQKLFLNPRINFNKLCQQLVWNNIMLCGQHWFSQFEHYLLQVKQIFKCHTIFDKFIWKFNLMKKEDEKDYIFLKNMYQQLLVCCFHHKRFQIFSMLFFSKMHIIRFNSQFRNENFELICEIAKNYINYLRKHTSIEQLANFSHNFFPQDHRKQSGQDQSSQNYFYNLKGVEGVFYEFLLSLGEPFSKYFQEYERIINHNQWIVLQNYAVSNNFSFRQTKFASLNYYNLMRYKAIHQRNLKKIYTAESQFLKIANNEIPEYIFKSFFWMILDIKKYQSASDQERINKTIIWFWKFHEISNNMQAYFSQNEKRKLIIFDTLEQLHLSSEKEKVYQFLQSIIKVLGKSSHRYYVTLFITNISIFYFQFPQFFNYQILKRKFQPINWRNRYQILCLSLALIRSINDSQIFQIIKILIKNLHYVEWNCQQTILNHYFQTIFKRKTLSIFKQRKTIYLYKFISTKIYVENQQYHQSKIKIFLKFIGYHRKKQNLFHSLLKKKILKWNFEQQQVGAKKIKKKQLDQSNQVMLIYSS